MPDDHRHIEINDVGPTSLSHIIGQRGVVAQVAVALDAAFADDKKLDDALLVGPPGLGKTQVAKVIAAELASEVHEVLGQAIETPADLNALLLTAKGKDVVFIDEVHELAKEFQTALYLAIDQRRVLLAGGNSGRMPQSIPISNFTLLLATTDEYSLLAPLRDRMRLTLRFVYYDDGELVEVVKHRSRAVGWRVAEDVLPEIAGRSRGTPRLALRLLQSCRRVCRAEGEAVITIDHLRRACLLEQLDDLGLGPIEQKYIEILAQGVSRLNVIASMLGLPSRTVAEVSEPFLIRTGLMIKDDQGRRQLTSEGRERLLVTRQQRV
ncbi:AAA family ATPase [Paludisphaera sp.]|uniref:AAA family ATPase n=1 Tax=Paludisphaera sp. TaxID=2017432 RepID=UPI00301E2CF7